VANNKQPYTWTNLKDDFLSWRLHLFLLCMSAFGYFVWFLFAPDCSAEAGDVLASFRTGWQCEKLKELWVYFPLAFMYGFFFISLVGRFLQAACNSVSMPSLRLDKADSGVETYGPERMAQLERWSDEKIKREFYRLADTKNKTSQEEEDWGLLHFLIKDRDLLL